MCQHLSTIKTVVNEYVNDNKMFTAFDVTKEVRARVRDRVSHTDVRRDVHSMFSTGTMFGYNRTLANLAGVNPQPWIYHPLSVDSVDALDTYKGTPVAFAVPAVAFDPTPTDSITSVDLSDDSVDSLDSNGNVIFKLDTTDRLCVPAKLVREVGWKAKDTVQAICESNELILTQSGLSDQHKPALTNYTVDCYDNIRISAGTLLRAGIAGVSYEIKREGQSIKVKKYA